MEIRAGNERGAKLVFSRCLLTCLSVDLWQTYLRFIRKARHATKQPVNTELLRPTGAQGTSSAWHD